jgi:hypothetical protein
MEIKQIEKANVLISSLYEAVEMQREIIDGIVTALEEYNRSITEALDELLKEKK